MTLVVGVVMVVTVMVVSGAVIAVGGVDFGEVRVNYVDGNLGFGKLTHRVGYRRRFSMAGGDLRTLFDLTILRVWGEIVPFG